jgi:hypothetical protein
MVQLLYEQGLHRFIRASGTCSKNKFTFRENLETKTSVLISPRVLPMRRIKQQKQHSSEAPQILVDAKIVLKSRQIVEKEKSRSKIMPNLWRPLQKQK